MMLTILLIIYAIMFILALIYLAANWYTKHDHANRIAAREKYQEHIDDMVAELFPPSIQTLPDTDSQWEAEQYQEAKRKMVADIRTYFNQRKINAAIAKILGPDELAPVNPYSKQTFLTPPCIERLME